MLFRANVTMGKKCDESDFNNYFWCQAGWFQKLLNWDFHHSSGAHVCTMRIGMFAAARVTKQLLIEIYFKETGIQTYSSTLCFILATNKRYNLQPCKTQIHVRSMSLTFRCFFSLCKYLFPVLNLLSILFLSCTASLYCV